MLTRRQFIGALPAVAAIPLFAPQTHANDGFKLRYVLSSAMYGEMPLEVILPEVSKVGAEAIDIWCRVHGNQREQIAEMGDEAFGGLLAKHRVQLGVSTRYPLGPFKLQEEMAWVKKFGGKMVLCGCTGPKEPEGAEARTAISNFIEEMKPHVAKAEELGIIIAIENHSKQALYHPDSLRYFGELNRSKHLGVAFAPHHLHKWADQIPALLRDLGGDQIPFVYFQEHSDGIFAKASKEIEMQQMPGFGGGLDYNLIIKVLRDVHYKGYVEIFMHPTPRGIPVLPTVEEITSAIQKSRAYVEDCVAKTA
jgi:sugar phosphate isomerase/epimerase